jgi:hypothetical protein
MCHDLPQTSIFCGKICDAEKLANYHSSHSHQQILDLHLTIMDVLLRLGGLIYPDNLVIKKPELFKFRPRRLDVLCS